MKKQDCDEPRMEKKMAPPAMAPSFALADLQDDLCMNVQPERSLKLCASRDVESCAINEAVGGSFENFAYDEYNCEDDESEASFKEDKKKKKEQDKDVSR